MPRQTSLSPALADAICKLIEAGHQPNRAAYKMGVSRSTWSRWIRQGNGQESPQTPECADLVARIEGITLRQIEDRVEAALND